MTSAGGDPGEHSNDRARPSPVGLDLAKEKEIEAAARHFVKPGYSIRQRPEYFHDTLVESTGIVHQPDVYPFAAHLARRHGCSTLIDIGCGAARKLVAYHPELRIVGVDFGPNLDRGRRACPSERWIDHDLESETRIPIDAALARESIVICSDVIEHLRDPGPLLGNLRRLLASSPAAVLSTPERDRVRGLDDPGPPANRAHVREWNLDELRRLVSSHGIGVEFAGLTVNNDHNLEKKTSLIVLTDSSNDVDVPTPDTFRVVALMTAYNEIDIIEPSLDHLIDQGIEVYLVDNWSDDGTFEAARRYRDRGLLGIERFPAGGPSPTYDWHDLLRRVEQLGSLIQADWFIHHDVDEVRAGPWPDLDLRRSLHRVDRAGYNAVDHTVLVYPPTDEGFRPGTSFDSYFEHFEFGSRPGHFSQIKAWKNPSRPVRLADSGGHDCRFEGRRVYPYKFLLKHYPVRSQEHGERKILRERRERWNPAERARGWHTHYDHVRPGASFLRDAATLDRSRIGDFHERFLTERLTGVGIVR